MSEPATYAFAADLIGPIVAGDKTATVRHADERHVSPGDRVVATDPEGNQFAKLQITEVAELPVIRALEFIRNAGGEHGCDNPDELIAALQGHYPAANFAFSTAVRAIVFERVDGDLQ